MRRLTLVGATLAIGGMVVAAYGLYQLLHFETCFSNDVVGKAVECTKHVAGDGYLVAGAITATVIGLFIANSLFRVLFPLFWVIVGSGALLAAATSSTTVSPGVEGAPASVAHLPNVSRTVGFELGGMFVAIGIVLFVVFWGMGVATGRLRGVLDQGAPGQQPYAGTPSVFGGRLGALEQAGPTPATGIPSPAPAPGLFPPIPAAAPAPGLFPPIPGGPPAGAAPPPGSTPPGAAPAGGAPTELSPELHDAMLASARNALAAIHDPATRKVLIDQYRRAGIPIDEAGNPIT